MSLVADADRAGLTAIQPQVSAALAQAHAALSLPAPQLDSALAALSEARGAFEIVALPALARFVEAMQRALTCTPPENAPPPVPRPELVARSVRALSHLLDMLARGAPYRPLCLSALYLELCAASGTPGGESDLYFPDLSRARTLAEAWAHPVDPGPGAAERRALFQAGLLRFLKGERAGLAGMRGALEGLQDAAGSPLQRAAWTAVEAFLDAVQSGALEATAPVKRACGRIDRELRDVASSGAGAPEPLLREMLFHLAKAGPGSALVDAQVELYGLAGTTEVVAVDAAHLEDARAALEAARAAVAAAQSACERWLCGEASGLPELKAETAKLTAAAPALENAALCDLAQAIAALLPDEAEHPDATAQADLVDALTVAEALLAEPDAGASGLQAPIAQLLERATARVNGIAVPGERVRPAASLASQPLQAVVSELVAAVHGLEQTIETAFAQPEHRTSLTQLDTKFVEIKHVLYALGEEQAAREAARCHELVSGLAAAPDATAQDWSEAATSIARMVTRLESIGHEPLQPVDAPAQAAPAAAEETQPAAKQPAPAPAAVDETDELREIFLDEAAELLASIEQHLGILHKDNGASAPLTEIRRSFHTLKGSGRIAGQTALGDGAWQIEKLLNEWLDGRRPVTGNLVELLSYAQGMFAGWVAAIRAGAGEPDGSALQRAADAVRAGKPFDAPGAAAEAPAAPATVRIGTVTLPIDLYEIFVAEAQRHVATLSAQLDALRAGAVEWVADEMLRAAHTLGGIAGTARMRPMSELGYALEERLQGIRAPVPDGAMRVLEACVHACAAMLRDIAERRAPVADEALLRALRSLTADTVTANSQPATFGADQEAVHAPAAAPLSADGEAPQSATADSWVVLPADGVDRAVTVLLQTQAPVIALGETSSMRLPCGETLRDLRLTDHALTARTLTGMLTAQLAADIAVEQPGPVERRREEVADDIDEHLLPLFLEEAGELVPQAVSFMQRLHADAGDADATSALKRALHTLKGSARMAGAMIAGEIAHGIETRLDGLGRAPDRAAWLDEMQQSFDRFTDRVERLREYQPVRAGGSTDKARAADAQAAAMRAEPRAAAGGERTAVRAVLRVRADVVDRLVNQAGEVSVARSRIEGEVRTLRAALQRPERQRRPSARPAARDRDPGRVAAAVGGVARGRAALRSARVRPLHALPGAHARHGGKRERRGDRAAGAVQGGGRIRGGIAQPGAPGTRVAGGAVGRADGAVLQPLGAPAPDRAPDRQGAGQARQPGDRGRAGRDGP